MQKTVIKGGHILTCGRGLRSFKGSIFIVGSTIARVGELGGEYRESMADEVIDASGCVVTPGLINLHTHAGSNALRGLAEGMPLTPWLNKYGMPAHKYLKKEDARYDYLISYMEMVRGGITSALDMYRFLEEGIDAANLIGIRANLVPYAADLPQYDYLESPKENVRLLRKYSTGAGLAKIWLGFEHSTFCTDECLINYGEVKKAYDAPLHTHESETSNLVKEVQKRFGMRPIDVLKKFGLLGPKTVLAHCVWLDDHEITALATSGTSVSHCPTANMKLASGVAPVTRMLEKKVNVGLGTDSTKCNNRLDMIQEMKTASILQKLQMRDASVLGPIDVFKMATTNGARALGMEEALGKIETGYRADLAILDFRKLHLTPLIDGDGTNNVLTSFVYSSMASDVKTVLVNGQLSMKDYRIVNVDEEEVMKSANARAADLLSRIGIK